MKKGNRINSYFAELLCERREVTILGWFYGAIAVLVVILSGFTALLNRPVGAAMLIIPFVILVAFSLNLFAWGFVKFFIERLHPELRAGAKQAKKSDKAKKTTKKVKPSSKIANKKKVSKKTK